MIKKIITKKSRLRVKSSDVKDFERAIKIAKDMKDTLIANKGVGLAAIQIGVSKRIIWITTFNQTEKKSELQLMINPFIENDETHNFSDSQESCLSLPGKTGKIKRNMDVIVRYQNLKGDWLCSALWGQEAFVAQHEIDHLDGILITDKFF